MDAPPGGFVCHCRMACAYVQYASGRVVADAVPRVRALRYTGEDSMLKMTFWPALALALTSSIAMASDIRRVVTGLDANTKAVVRSVSRFPPSPGPYGLASTTMWITDSSPPALSFPKGHPATRPIGI